MKRNRSFFGPLLLIAAGMIWLLVQMGNIPAANLWALTHIWPFLLIAAGLGIILKPYWQYTSLVLDVLILGGAILAILFAPQLGWASPSMLSMITNDGELVIGPGERGSGNVVSETREISGFRALEIDYPTEVIVRQGNQASLEIEAEDNLLPGLKTEVENNVLRIFYKTEQGKHVNPTRVVKITIVTKDLADVEFNSAGELTIEGLKTSSLDVSLSGAGNLELDNVEVKGLGVNLSGAGSMIASGTTNDLEVNISGFGDFKGADLHGKTASVDISGAGSATVWVDDDLTASVSGAGSISYYGSASVTKQISGLGNVNHAGTK